MALWRTRQWRLAVRARAPTQFSDTQAAFFVVTCVVRGDLARRGVVQSQAARRRARSGDAASGVGPPQRRAAATGVGPPQRAYGPPATTRPQLSSNLAPQLGPNPAPTWLQHDRTVAQGRRTVAQGRRKEPGRNQEGRCCSGKSRGLLRELNLGPLASLARIMPLDQVAM